jgi:hypothetical protein
VVLNNMDPQRTGSFFYLYVLNLLLNGRFGLNEGVPAKVQAANAAAVAQLRSLGRENRPVSHRALAQFLGYYKAATNSSGTGTTLKSSSDLEGCRSWRCPMAATCSPGNLRRNAAEAGSRPRRHPAHGTGRACPNRATHHRPLGRGPRCRTLEPAPAVRHVPGAR